MHVRVADMSEDHVLAGEFGLQQARIEFQHLPVRGDQIKIVKTGKTYWVRDSNRDGQGGTMLQLAEREPQ